MFKEKVKTTSLSCMFEDYTEHCSVSKDFAFVKKKFLDVVDTRSGKIETHATCATDPDSIKTVVTNVMNDSIKKQIVESFC